VCQDYSGDRAEVLASQNRNGPFEKLGSYEEFRDLVAVPVTAGSNPRRGLCRRDDRGITSWSQSMAPTRRRGGFEPGSCGLEPAVTGTATRSRNSS